uniref:Ubiquitin-like protease family profile domain-containing protein n=1 Tax=Ditylenchus dipsaci TaxID=166011 RepID=A0A915E518_9BILA
MNSNSGNKKYFHDGRLHFKQRLLRGVNDGKVSTECDQKLKGCKVRAWFFEDGRFFKIVTPHGCDPDPSHIAATAIRNEVKQLATSTTMRTGEIVGQVRKQSRTSGIQDNLQRWQRGSVEFKEPAQILMIANLQKVQRMSRQYLQQESMQKRHEEVDPVNWLGFNDKTIPQQSNSYDCGVFVCLFAESVSREVRPEFEQNQLDQIRRRIVKEILDGVMSEQKKIDESNVW